MFQLPPDHPEFVPDAELAREKKLNARRLQAEYLGECADLRASVFGALMRHGALTCDLGWGVFLDQKQGGDEPSDKHTLLYVASMVKEAGKPARTPSVRIITNETFREPGLVGPTALVKDFMLDYENDAWMYFGATTREQANPNRLGEFVANLDPRTSGIKEISRPTSAAIFMVTSEIETGIAFSVNTQPMPVVEAIDYHDSGKIPQLVTPFGEWKCDEDRQFALDTAREIIAGLDLAEPQAVYRPAV